MRLGAELKSTVLFRNRKKLHFALYPLPAKSAIVVSVNRIESSIDPEGND